MTKFTTEQLTEWAGLGPWFDMDLSGVSNEPPVSADVIVSCSWPDIIEVACMGRALTATIDEAKNNAALIAAAPDLAAALLAKEAEVAELKAAALDLISQCHASIKMTGIHYTPVISTRFNRSVELLLETINKPRQAMKDQPHD